MPMAVALLLLSLGCAQAEFTASNGTRMVVWVCPPVQAAQPPEPEEREG